MTGWCILSQVLNNVAKKKSGGGVDRHSSVCRMNCRGFDNLRSPHSLFLSGDLHRQALLQLNYLRGGSFAEIRHHKPPANIELSSLLEVRALSPEGTLISFPVRIEFGLCRHGFCSPPSVLFALHQ